MRTTIIGLAGFLVFTSAAFADSIPRYLELCELDKATILGATTSPEHAALPGVYDGKWSGELNSALVLVNVGDDGAVEAFYAWDRYPKWNIKQAGCVLRSGRLEDGVIVLKSNNNISYRIQDSGEFSGTFFNSRFTNRGTFTKMNADTHPWSEK